ncbi:MAG: hypothetical protein QME07_04150 [bacterium]|nr:hypothetical protein [bacterium]
MRRELSLLIIFGILLSPISWAKEESGFFDKILKSCESFFKKEESSKKQPAPKPKRSSKKQVPSKKPPSELKKPPEEQPAPKPKKAKIVPPPAFSTPTLQKAKTDTASPSAKMVLPPAFSTPTETLKELPPEPTETEGFDAADHFWLGTETKEGYVTNIFVDTNIRQAIKDMAFQVGEKVVLDDTVRGVVSAEIDNLPFEKALEQVLIQGGYTYRKIDEYYLIGVLDKKNPTFKYLSVTERIKVEFIDPERCQKLLPDSFSSYITPNKEDNSLIITAPPSIIEKIKELLKIIDVKPHQILVEVLVTEILRKSDKSFGMKLGWQPTDKTQRPEDILETIAVNVNRKDAIAEIKALVEKGEAEIKANPKILTLEGKPASISIGKEEYYRSPATLYQPYAKFDSIKTGIKINVTPLVTSKNEIFLSIEPEVSDVTEVGEEGLPVITRRTTKTEILTKPEETIVIGGLFQQKKEKRRTGIPILEKIPLLGNILFSRTVTKKNETELTIFITTYIVE